MRERERETTMRSAATPQLLLNNSSIIFPIRLFPGPEEASEVGPPARRAGGRVKRMKSKSIENQRHFWRKSLPPPSPFAAAFAANMTIVNIRKGRGKVRVRN